MDSVNFSKKVVLLGVGGTIAALAAAATDNLGYIAGQLNVDTLLQAVLEPAGRLAGCEWVAEQVANIDSKDMDFDVWRKLALRAWHHLAQPDVQGVVITHGTDTLEETAFFLHTVLPHAMQADKPVVLTCAMRPASSMASDGPQNLLDALAVATTPGACGVLVVCAGVIHSALRVQKDHSYRLDAFSSGDAGPLGFVEEGGVRLTGGWPLALSEIKSNAIEKIANEVAWPRVEIVMSYAGVSGAMVDALLLPNSASPLRGLVVAATGNGTVHQELEAALIQAQQSGVIVLRATRCANGRVLPTAGHPIPDSQGLSPVKARVALMLALM